MARRRLTRILGGYDGWDIGTISDAVGPLTSHIMWTKPLQSGGVVGGNNFQIAGDTYFEGSAYLPRYNNPIILDGMLYYTEPLSYGAPVVAQLNALACKQEQLIWSSQNIPALSFGLIFDVQDQNEHEVFPPMIISTIGGATPFGVTPATWLVYDGDTGTPMFNVTNVPVGTAAMGPNGEYLTYVLSNDGTPTNPQYYLSQWNSSNLWSGQYSGGSTSPSLVPPITDGSNPSMYDWNVSVPSLNSLPAAPSILQAFSGNMLLCMEGSYPAAPAIFTSHRGTPSDAPYTYFALSVNASNGEVGTVLWTNSVIHLEATLLSVITEPT